MVGQSFTGIPQPTTASTVVTLHHLLLVLVHVSYNMSGGSHGSCQAEGPSCFQVHTFAEHATCSALPAACYPNRNILRWPGKKMLAWFKESKKKEYLSLKERRKKDDICWSYTFQWTSTLLQSVSGIFCCISGHSWLITLWMHNCQIWQTNTCCMCGYCCSRQSHIHKSVAKWFVY